MLCAVIRKGCLDTLERANRLADLIELWVDDLPIDEVARLREACAVPVIFKGGPSVFNLLHLNPDYIDLPHYTDPKLFARVRNIKTICSFHDFEKTPHNLGEILKTMKRCHADVYKLATMAHSTLDSVRMLRFVKNSRERVVGLCMGEEGAITRILAPVVGSQWTYAPLDDVQRSAPGQLLLEELGGVYQTHTLNRHTRLYGLIGDPITQSPSHRTHNFAFERLGINAVYVKMRVTPETLAKTLPALVDLGFSGLSVTMPLKEAILPHVDVMESPSKAINTLAIRRGKIHGWNTDGVGSLDALEKEEAIAGKRLVLLGAGGAARGISKEAVKRGADVVILNRTFNRARALAEEVGAESGSLKDFSSVAEKGYDFLINCLPVESPEATEALLEKRVVMDIRLKPLETPLLKEAKRKGCRVIPGIEMFIQQAVGQYTHWFEDLCLKK